jgi:hypothetical protein
VSPNVLTGGTRVDFETWTGSPHPATPGPNSSATCGDWRDPDASKSTTGYSFDTTVGQFWFAGKDNANDCTVARHVTCLQD